ncbi:hypothetical protein [Paenibacillus sonchi]|uniref:hypothetical protein n=1 Tax=Paenibacillus sonchi TaxID=373687 RepID=UPI001F307A3A|nr:hypothetical protein [Paenibacillus sonchi]
MKRFKRSKMNAVSLMVVLCMLLVMTATACSSDSPKTASSPKGGNNQTAETSAPENTADPEMEPEQGAKLMVWEAKEQLEYMKGVAADFEKKYGVPVTVEELAGGDQGDGWLPMVHPSLQPMC